MLTVQEIAQRLRVEHKTVRSLIKSGKLKAVRLGRSLRIREADYEQFLEENLVKA
jgi:excisionase family DNA binding protein